MQAHHHQGRDRPQAIPQNGTNAEQDVAPVKVGVPAQRAEMQCNPGPQ